MLGLILAVLTLLFISGLCSLVEAALFSVPVLRARTLAQSGKRSALALLSICEDMTKPISAIVVLINISNILGSIMVGNIAGNVLGDKWLGVFSGVLTFLVIVFAEIIPKTLGERHAERVSLISALPVKGFTWMLTPVIWALNQTTKPFTRGQNLGPTIDEAEIKLMASIGHKEGVIEEKESEIIQRVFELGNATASNLMTPRVAMTCIEGNQSLAEAIGEIMDSQHSRILVIDGSRDKVTGLVHKHELLAAMIRGQGTRLVSSFQHKVRFVPEARRADTLLGEFQLDRQHLAVVADEYGGVAGVISLEDVVEVLTGEIVDETDRTVDLQEIGRRKRREVERRKLGKIDPLKRK